MIKWGEEMIKRRKGNDKKYRKPEEKDKKEIENICSTFMVFLYSQVIEFCIHYMDL